jgi:hypothetical protein
MIFILFDTSVFCEQGESDKTRNWRLKSLVPGPEAGNLLMEQYVFISSPQRGEVGMGEIPRIQSVFISPVSSGRNVNGNVETVIAPDRVRGRFEPGP